MWDTPWPVSVVDRFQERERLSEAVRQAVSGHGGTVLIEGEPGAGKSTLLNIAADEAARLGVRVRRAGATDLAGAPPFAAIASWLDGEATPLDAGTGGGDAADREFVVTEAVVDLVDRWCAAGPVALLVDDLQWADPSSLLVLARLGRAVAELPLVLIAGYQPTPRGAELDALLRSLRTRGAVQVRLDPLAVEDVRTLVREHLGAEPGPDLDRLVAGAGGNPLYLTELLKALALQGRIRVTDGVAWLVGGAQQVPRSLVELILHRLSGLSPRTRELLRGAAILGPSFDVAELAAVLGNPVIELWQPISDAVTAGLLSDVGGNLVFRHDLIRRALADGVPPEVRAVLHMRAGRALAAAGAPAEWVAQHLVAGGALDHGLLTWLDRAADTLTARAPDLAVELLGRGLAHSEDFRFRYARALLWAGRPDEAQDAIRTALEGDPDVTQVTTLRWLLAQSYFQRGRLDDALADAEDVLATAELDETVAARFHGFVAQCLLLSGQLDAAEAAAGQAGAAGWVVHAGTNGDGTDRFGAGYGYSARAGVLLVRGRPEAALKLADLALATLADQEVQPDHQLAPHLIRALCLLDLGRDAEADAAAEDGRVRSERGGGAFLTWHHLARVRLRFLDGRWDDALAEAQAGLEATDALGATEALRSHVALIAMHRGDFATYSALLDHRDASLGSRYWGFCRLSAQSLRWEQDDRAERGLDALMHAWERLPMRCLAPDLARLAGVTGQGSRLRPVAEALDALVEQHPGPHVRAAASVCRGLADGDPAVVLAGADKYRDAGRPLYAGQGYENAAALLAGAGDTVAAKRALDSAVECYEPIGAAFDRSRAEERLRRAGVRRRHVRTRPKTGWDALTDTERRIAAFVADGWSNPDIATELFLSRRTVRNHVSHILAKLGLSSRVELAVYAYDHRSQ